MIELDEVRYTRGGRTIVDGVSHTFAAGSMGLLLGPSGCGKTTVLHLMGQLVSPTSGRVIIGGDDTSTWGGRRRREFWARQGSFVFQDLGLVTDASALDNVLIGLSARDPWGLRTKQGKVEAGAALEAVGLAGRSSEIVSHLSGGERQRVALARAIAKGASYYFVDEPTASLDAENRELVMRLFEDRAADGACVVVATHDDWLLERCPECLQLD